MQNLKKTKLATVILILILTTNLTFFALLPNVSAQTQFTNEQEGGSMPMPSGVTPDYTVETTARLSFSPNPIGVGQTILVNFWLAPPIHPSHYFNNYTLTITKPDGTKQAITKQSFRADTTAYYQFAPDQEGNWTIKFDFPGGYFPPGNYSTLPGAWIGASTFNFPYSVYYKPSSIGPLQLTVQQEPVSTWPGSPIPTDYWTRPVSPENREWWPILGYYPPTGIVGGDNIYWANDSNTYAQPIYRYVPYTEAAKSPHVMWKEQDIIGGVIGGPLGDKSWNFIDPSYINLYAPSAPTLIYAGRAYWSRTLVVDGQPTLVFQCFDLRTGKLLWQRQNMTQVPTMITYWEGYADLPGGEPLFGRSLFLTYVGGGRVVYYHPWTAAVVYNVSISPLTTGTFYENLNTPYFLTVQNLGNSVPLNQRYRLINWTVAGDPDAGRTIANVTLRIAGNITWPFSSLGQADFEAGVAVTTVSIDHPGTLASPLDTYVMAADLKTGQLLWNVSSGIPYPVWAAGGVIVDHGKVAVRFEEGHFYAWDLRTGTRLWKSEETSTPWGLFNAYGTSSYGGMIITGQYDGVAAYDWETGKVKWLYKAEAPYPYESPYQSAYPYFSGSPLIADGVVYMSNAEHTATEPITRGWKLAAINATTGVGIWNITGSLFQISGGIHAGDIAISDGYLAFPNSYDGYTYIFGKGPSATTVTAPDKGITLGDSIVIKGTVTDQSEAQKGTPAISDANMASWMEYTHMGLPFPKNATGVPVAIDVIDANGNYRNIGTSTSDTSGNFAFAWKPDIPGFYQVIAKFAGSNSYGSSSATAYFNVQDIPTSTAPPGKAIPTSLAEQYFLPLAIFMIVAILFVAILLALLLLRKRP